MFRPTSLRILGKPYRVVYSAAGDMAKATYLGQHDVRHSTIRVLDGMAAAQERETLLHECLHAMGGALMTEEQISVLSQQLYCFAQDNPQAVGWMLGLSEKAA